MDKKRSTTTRVLTGMVLGMVLGIVVVKMLGDDPRWNLGRQLSGAGDERDKTRPLERTVERVIDGDTVVLQGGERVRFVGVDAPEVGEPLYEEAREFQEKVLLGRHARIETCREEPRDDYGRTLAFVHMDNLDVGAQLLRYGLARTLFVGPCGRAVARGYRKAEREAFRGGRGIWSLQQPRLVPHDGAARYVGCLMSVTGRVANVHAGAKAFHLNFGKDYRTDFTVVVFRKDLSRLLEEGLQPVTAYEGRFVEVTGTLKDYNGPEIIVESADQIVLQEKAP